MSLPAPVVTAWQAALDAEHRAVFGYGTLGPRLPTGTAQAQGRAVERAHRILRDAVITAMTGAGVTPRASAVDYPAPFPISTATAARKYALALESGAAATWRYLVAVAADQQSTAALSAVRAAAVRALSDGAVRAVYWREGLTPTTPTVAFPGVS